MAVTLETLQIEFRASMGNLTAQLNNVKAQLTGVNTHAIKASGGMSRLANMAKAFIGMYIVRGMWQLGKASLQMANDVVESENLFSVSMGSMAGEARKWSEELSKSLGLNAYNLRKNVGTFNVMFESMGVGSSKAYEMATSLTQLAEDMASFYNLSSEDAFTKLRAGITGETEPLKRLGILVDENTVKQYALANGIGKAGGELTQQEKLLARYLAIMDQTSKAHGDMARTIMSPANQLRVLSNTLDMVRIALGQAFQPILSAVLPLLNTMAGALIPVMRAIKQFLTLLTGFSGVNIFAAGAATESADAQDGLADALDRTKESVGGAGKAAKKAAKDMNVGLKAFDEINKLAEESADKAGGGGGGGIGEQPEVPEPPDVSIWDTVTEKIRALAEAMMEFWEKLKTSLVGKAIGAAWDALKTFWNTTLKPIGEWMLAHPGIVADTLTAIGIAIASWKIMTGHSAMLNGISTALKTIGPVISAFPEAAIATAIGIAIVGLASAINEAWETAKKTDLANRFGSVRISMEELKSICATITTPFYNATDKLKTEFEAIAAAADRLESLAMDSSKIIFAYSLDPAPLTDDQVTSLKDRMQTLIDEGIALAKEAGLVSAIGIELAFGDTEQGKAMAALSADNFAAVNAEAQKRGAELQAALSEALLDDTITPEERANLIKLQAKYTSFIIEATNTDIGLAKFRMHQIAVDFSGATLTADTVINFNAALDEQLANMQKSNQTMIEAQAALELSAATATGADQSELDAIMAAWESALNAKNLEAQLVVDQVRIEGVGGQISAAYGKELESAQAAANLMSTDWMAKAAEQLGISFGTASDAEKLKIKSTATAMFSDAIKDIELPTGAAEATMKQYVALLEPSAAQWQKTYDDLKSGGQEVPAWLAKGLNDYMALKAVTDAADVTLGTLQTTLDAPKNYPIYTSTGGKAGTTFADGVSGKADYTKTAGTTLNTNANDGMDDTTGADAAGKAVGQGFADGMSKKTDSVTSAAKRLAQAANKAFKDTLDTGSPSRVMMEIGGFVGEGLAMGIDATVGRVTESARAMAGATINALDMAQGVAGGALYNGAQMSIDATDSDRRISGAISAAINGVLDRLQINLNVDGQTFGRASIRAINDVQRRAGAILFEM